MRLSLVRILLLLLASNIACASEPETRDPRDFFFTHTFGNLPEEMETAREDGKLGMFLFFESDACPYCQHMLKNVFNQKPVQDWYTKHFVNIAVDIYGDVELKDFDGITLPSKIFADQRRIFLTPVMSFIDLNGVEIYRHLGMIKTAEEFLFLGKYIEGEHYYDTEYSVFSKARGMKRSGELLTTPATDPGDD